MEFIRKAFVNVCSAGVLFTDYSAMEAVVAKLILVAIQAIPRVLSPIRLPFLLREEKEAKETC